MIFLRKNIIDILVQDCSISSASALELLQSCTKPLISIFHHIWTLRLHSSWNSSSWKNRRHLCCIGNTMCLLMPWRGKKPGHQQLLASNVLGHHQAQWFSRSCPISWRHHQMETFSATPALCVGNSPVAGRFPSQRPVMQSCDVSLICVLNKRLSKQSWGWWFKMPPRSLWCHCND